MATHLVASVVRPAVIATFFLGRWRARPVIDLTLSLPGLPEWRARSRSVCRAGAPLRGLGATGCWEVERVMSRFGFAFLVGCACLTTSMTGCSDAWNAGPMQYVENETLTNDVKGKANLYGKPELQVRSRRRWRRSLVTRPSTSRSPKDRDCPLGGSTSAITFKRERAPTPSFTPSTKIQPQARP
jgi:hypothetical protein